MGESTPVESQAPVHDILKFEAIVSAPPEVVFALYADITLRERWSAPSPSAIVRYEAADLRVGGRDIYVCGDRDAPQYRGVVDYHDVVAPSRIVFSESISLGGDVMFVSLNTWCIEPHTASASRLSLVIQMTSLVGPGAARGIRVGTSSMLANLERMALARSELS